MTLLDVLAGSPALFIAVCVFFGLMIGSFLNVVIHRLPIMMDNAMRDECAELAGKEPEARPRYNVVTPRSACPKCKAPITALQNVPVVSWLALRGKCAGCGTKISARYPLIEALTGIASGLVAWRFGFGMLALAGLAFTWILIALTFIDLDTKLLPDVITYPLLWIGLALSTTNPVWAVNAAPVTPSAAIFGAITGYLVLWSLYWIFKLLMNKEGMGYGDFKLFAAFGAWFGWKMLLPIMLCASLVGSVVGIYVLRQQKKGFDTQIPFGPYLAAAGWLFMLIGHASVDRYLATFTRMP
jgi:leader peptidase (prepilin peptidase)/N-methyltransferase